MADPRGDKSEVQRAISDHIAAHGPVQWEKVRERYPDVPIATFWRWVRSVKGKPTQERIQAARDLLAVTPGASVTANAPLPAPVSIGAITAGGAEATRQVNFLREFDELVTDAKLLRSFAMSQDGTKVKLPRIFVDAAKLRLQLLQMWISAIPFLYSMERAEQFYAAIVDAVAECEPDVARQITSQLKKLSAHAGYVVVNRPGF